MAYLKAVLVVRKGITKKIDFLNPRVKLAFFITLAFSKYSRKFFGCCHNYNAAFIKDTSINKAALGGLTPRQWHKD